MWGSLGSPWLVGATVHENFGSSFGAVSVSSGSFGGGWGLRGRAVYNGRHQIAIMSANMAGFVREPGIVITIAKATRQGPSSSFT